jgi:metal-sulfur cluster biosynthetic enzyme
MKITGLILLTLFIVIPTHGHGEPLDGDSVKNETRPIFYLTKNIHPQNILHYEVRITPDCHFDGKARSPFKIFWVMGEGTINSGAGYAESMTKTEAAHLGLVITGETNQTLHAHIKSISHIKDADMATIKVTLSGNSLSNCSARAWIANQVESDPEKVTQFDVVNLTFKGVIPPRLKDITVFGFSDNGQRISRRYLVE